MEYTIPLRREWLKVPVYKRTRYAVNTVRRFIQKHMKVEDVKLGKYLNLKLWERGNRKPPHKIKVEAELVEEKDKKYVKVELFGAPKEEQPEIKKKGLVETLKEKIAPEKKIKVAKEEEEKQEKTKAAIVEREDILKKEDQTLKSVEPEKKVAKGKKDLMQTQKEQIFSRADKKAR